MAIGIRAVARYDSPAACTDAWYRPLVLLGDLSAGHLARLDDSFGQYALVEKNWPPFRSEPIHARKGTQTAAIHCIDSLYCIVGYSFYSRMGPFLRAI